MSFLPAHRVVEAPGARPERTVWFLHGILGSSRNWRGFARRLVESRPWWRAVLVDLRNHGESTGAPGPHTLEACAADLETLLPAPDAVCGHSFGGKVALVFARDHRPRPAALWVLDSPPGRVPAGERRIEAVFDLVDRLRMPVRERAEVARAFSGAGHDAAFASWMTTNLRPVEGGFAWTFDPVAAREMIGSYFEWDLWPFVEASPTGLDLHFVRGGASDRWSDEELARLERAPVARHVLPGAGHLLHADDPSGLLAILEANGF